jgi:hypothetical protein
VALTDGKPATRMGYGQEALATVAAARDAEDGCRVLLRRAREAARIAGAEAGVASDLTVCVVRLSHPAGLEEGIQ